MLTTIEIGRRLAQARKNKGVSQAQVANHLAVSPQAVGKWERGESLPDIITLDKMALYFGISLNSFSELSTGVVLEPKIDTESEDEELLESTHQETPIDAEEVCYQANAGDSTQDRSNDTLTNGEEPELGNKSESIADELLAPPWDFSHGDWRDCDFSGFDNLAERLKGSNIRNCLFVDSDLKGLQLSGSNVSYCTFDKALLDNTLFKGCSVTHTNFKAASLQNTLIKGSSMINCTFDQADFTSATFHGSTLRRSSMQDAILKNTTFKGTQFSGITLSGNIVSCIFDNCSYSDFRFLNATLSKTFFKGSGLKKIHLVNCIVDKPSYVFLMGAKAKLENVTVID